MAARPNRRASIPMTLLDEVKQRADIVQIVSDYVDLDTSSRVPKARCPFHAERTPSFVVYPESGTWHCFGGCSTGGDAITFLMKQENFSFGDALRRLAERYGIDVREHDTTPDRGRSKRNDSMIEANNVAARYFRTLLAGQQGVDARQYLESRGISADASQRRGLGMAPAGMETLGGHLKARGVSSAAAVGAGLLTRRREGEWGDMFRGRITFEIHDTQGRIVGFGARSLDGSEPKYLNTQATELFDKSKILYGLDWAADAIRKSGRAVVVEGYMDVITAHENGFRNVVACMGTAVTSFQLQELSKLLSNPPRGVTSSITLCLDSDAAGEEATLRGLEEAWRSDAGRGPGSARNSVAVNVARSVGGKDPDEAIRTDPEGWRTSIANGQPLLDYLITAYSDRRDLFSGEGKAGLVGDVRPLILAIENSFEQDRYLTKLGELLSVPPERLRSMMQGPRPISRGTRMGMGRRAAPGRRSREERLDPAQVSNALDAANENGLEEHLLTLVLNYDNLRDYATGVPEDHFRDSGNRAIFTMWRTALTLDEVHSSMDDHLAGRVDQLKSKPLPPGDHLLKVQDVSQTVRRLHERHLRHMKRLQTEAFARMTPDAPAEELLQLRRTAAEADSRLKQVFTGRP